jgi:hypothetical protein
VLPIPVLASLGVSNYVEDPVVVNLGRETTQEAGTLPCVQAGRVLYVKQQLHLGFTSVDVLPPGASAAREQKLDLRHGDPQGACDLYAVGVFAVCDPVHVEPGAVAASRPAKHDVIIRFQNRELASEERYTMSIASPKL